ncbi:MAG: DUF1572 family protein [Bryobacteraceae bacterium]|nr:DUF1572 family protein [Bryobacteraceae bacterium]
MLETVFLAYAPKKLEQLAGRIAACLDTLDEEQIWGRAGGNSNAVGNLVLHLCGNVRQWIGFGVAKLPDVRMRDREFAARGGISRADLKERLAGVIAEAAGIIRSLPPERLTETVTIQGYDLTVFEAIIHVIEHFSGHTGQIIFAAKAMTEKDFGFYNFPRKPAAEKIP